MAKYCHFTKAILRQNGYKMVDFGNEVLINQLDTSTWREHCHVFTWPYAIHFIPTNMVRTRVRGTLRMRKQSTKTTVPLDVVPERRTKRFPPEISARGSLLWAKVQIPIVTDRQGGRDKSAPRPYQTDPIHPLSSTFRKYQSRYIYIEQSSRYFLHVARSGVY